MTEEQAEQLIKWMANIAFALMILVFIAAARTGIAMAARC